MSEFPVATVDVSAICIGATLVDRETRSVYVVSEVDANIVRYANDDCEGQITKSRLLEDFEVRLGPASMSDVETILRDKIASDDAETGLYSTSFGFVVVDRVNNEFVFQWFSEVLPIHSLGHTCSTAAAVPELNARRECP